jgi:hypothetical protein
LLCASAPLLVTVLLVKKVPNATYHMMNFRNPKSGTGIQKTFDTETRKTIAKAADEKFGNVGSLHWSHRTTGYRTRTAVRMVSFYRLGSRLDEHSRLVV